MKRIFNRYLLLVPIMAVLAACGTATNVANAPLDDSKRVRSVAVVEATPTVEVSDSMREYLRNAIQTEVYEEQGFERGSELKLEYRIISYKSGNRLKRFVSEGLGNWGEGGLMVKTTFTDANGNVVGALDTNGKIGSGIFGGGMKSAVVRVAENIGEYTASSYRYQY